MGQDQGGTFVIFFSQAAGDGLYSKLHHIRPHYQSCEFYCELVCSSRVALQTNKLVHISKVKKHAREKVLLKGGPI